MNNKLYKTHELFHKHSWKPIGKITGGWRLHKCNCGAFGEEDIGSEPPVKLDMNCPLGWKKRLMMLVDNLKLRNELMAYLRKTKQIKYIHSLYPLKLKEDL